MISGPRQYAILSGLWLLVLLSCNKEKDDPPKHQFTVSGLKDIEIEQGFDTTYLPLRITSETGVLPAVTVLNLPEQLKMTVVSADSVNGDIVLRFVSYYQSNKPLDILERGPINLRLVVSGEEVAEQLPFNITVKPHPGLMLFGNYEESCECFMDTVANQPVSVKVSNHRDDWNMEISGLQLYYPNVLIYYCEYDPATKRIPFQRCLINYGAYIWVDGKYDEHSIELNITPNFEDTCYVILKRQ